jgi:P pilus assembly chaperone PapD
MTSRPLSALPRAAAVAAAALSLWPVVADAVLVAPHALFLGDRARSGQIYLVNQGSTPEEVTIDLQFGYPEADSTGTMRIRLVDQPGPDDPSAAAWLRAFPRRVRVGAGQRQAVRIQATPPAGLPDGEYWSRLIVTSQEAQPAEAVANDSAVRAGITFALRTITSVTYRKGEVRTGLRLDSLSVIASTTHRDTIVTWIGLTREGNAAFLGSLRFELRDGTGALVREWGTTPIAVYYALWRRFDLPLEGIAPGHYRLHALVSTARQDIAPHYILPAAPVADSVAVEVR